jgi:hypothetical protein
MAIQRLLYFHIIQSLSLLLTMGDSIELLLFPHLITARVLTHGQYPNTYLSATRIVTVATWQ